MDDERVGPTTRLECKICWFVYDPRDGDELAQVSPGTSFRDLPSHWRCPQCDADKNHFLPLDEQ